MNPPDDIVRKPRAWLRRLRRIVYGFTLLVAIAAAALLWLYYNLSTVVVWFANRSIPGMRLELDHASFVTRQQIEFRKLSLRLEKESGQTLQIEKAIVDFQWRDLWQRRIGRISVENPRVHVTDDLLAAASGKSSPNQSEDTSADKLWRVEKFTVSGGHTDIDLSQTPSIKFGFSGDCGEIYLSSDIKFSTRQQSLSVDNVEMLGKGAKPVRFGTIKSIKVRFTLNQLAANKIDELSVDAPSFWLSPELFKVFSTDASKSPPAATTTAQALPTPWIIGKFHVTDGSYSMSGFGDSVPETSLKFASDEEDVEIGGGSDALGEKSHKLQLWDVYTAAAFARYDRILWIGSAQVDFTAAGLFGRREIGGVTITEMDFLLGQKFRSLLAAMDEGKAPTTTAQPSPVVTPPAADGASPWKIKDFRIINGRATLADLGVELPNIGFKLDTELNDLPLSGDIRYAGTDVQEVTIRDLTINSPHDPFVPVLNFASITLRFSLAEILRQKIEEVRFDRPTIFVGEQLFWYADELKQRAAATPAAAPQPGQPAQPQPSWSIDKLLVKDGGLVIANAGQAGLAVPFGFSSVAENLRFNDLSDLRLKVKLSIAEGDYAFPSYELAFKQLKGGLEFGLPPGSDARNVVQDFSAASVKWKQFDARKLWLSVTYDVNGIYGRFGGAAYSGYIAGEFDFYMQPDTPWSGWVDGTNLELKGITDALAPRNFQLSGPANFDVEVNGLNHEIERFTGKMTMKKPGKLRIGKLDELIAAIPAAWGSIKKGSTRITLETLRDFDYTSGNADFWFAGGQGRLALKVQGSRGSRNFDVAVHGN